LESKLTQKTSELEDVKKHYQRDYVKKECLIQIINKLQETFACLEFDASLLQKVMVQLKGEGKELNIDKEQEIDLCTQIGQ